MASVRSTVPSIRFSGDARPTTSRSSSRNKESRALHSTQRSRTTSSHIIHRHRRRRPSSSSQRRFRQDRKSTRLNSSHLVISYAVFCLKKKKDKSAYVGTERAIELDVRRCSSS